MTPHTMYPHPNPSGWPFPVWKSYQYKAPAPVYPDAPF